MIININDGKNAVPTLNKNQKDALKELADKYYKLNKSYNSNKGTFMYYGDTTRNSYANSRCWIESEMVNNAPVVRDQFGMCCNTFVEMVWMGRDTVDFDGKNGSTYSNKITPAFDWGYYPPFKLRNTIAGGANLEKNGSVITYDEYGIPNILGYYHYVNPNTEAGNYENSYSATSKYDEKSTLLYKQYFNSFMTQADLAYELYSNGYSIPIEELDVGDLIFTAPPGYNLANEDKTFINDMYWRNIDHVAMVYEKDVDGNLTFIECTDAVNKTTSPIVKCGVTSSYIFDNVRAEYMLKNTVMCARHPVAWGHSNMGHIKQIDYMPMKINHGRENNPIVITPNADGTMPSTKIKKDYYYTFKNKIGKANNTYAGVTAFSSSFFDNIV